MIIIRPIQHSDYAVLHDIAVESGIGFTSLPVNETLLKSKITDSGSPLVSALTMRFITTT